MFVNIPSATLKQLVKLSRRKEALMSQIQDIDREMIRLEREVEQTSRGTLKGRVTFSDAPGKKRGAARRAKRT